MKLQNVCFTSHPSKPPQKAYGNGKRKERSEASAPGHRHPMNHIPGAPSLGLADQNPHIRLVLQALCQILNNPLDASYCRIVQFIYLQYAYFSHGISIIEWGEIIEDILPKPYTKITFIKSENEYDYRELIIETIE